MRARIDGTAATEAQEDERGTMRIAEPVVCVVTAGMLFNLGAADVQAEARRPGPGSLQDRVFFDRSADPQEVAEDVRALLASIAAESAMVPLPAEPTSAARSLTAGPSATLARTVIAALAPAKDGPLNDGGASLPWASGPAVPRALSAPFTRIEPSVTRRHASDARLPRLDVYGPQLQWQGHARAPKLEAAKIRALCRSCAGLQAMSVEQDRVPMSPLPERKPMSKHAGDPLAALQLDDEDAETKAVAAEFIMPFAGGRVTSLFNDGRRHPAIDLAGKLGSPVLATTTRQTVVFAGRRGGYGNAVITRDAFGREHLYGHLKSITARVDQVLDQGDQLGHLGSTGRSTGPHVHYEVRNATGAHINPVSLLFPGRKVGRGLAWADVGEFAAPTEAASRVASSQPAATAAMVEAAPRRIRAKRKARPRQYRTAAYAHRWRRAASVDSD